MGAVSMDTLRRILEQLPTAPWDDEDLEELVAPKRGVITGFEQVIADVRALQAVDLGTLGLAGAVRPQGRDGADG